VDHVGHRLLRDLATRIVSVPPSLSAADAWTRAASEFGRSPGDEAPAPRPSLIYHLMEDGSLRLGWEFTPDAGKGPGFCGRVVVDASSGETLDRVSWTAALVPEARPPRRVPLRTAPLSGHPGR
jgi:hypothetical protein